MRALYSDTIDDFLGRSVEELLGLLSSRSRSTVEGTQLHAWQEQILMLRESLPAFRSRGTVFFEYSVPRIGKRIDVVLLIEHVVFVIEFKIGETRFSRAALEQVVDYAIDLKNFHETTHDKAVVPILVISHSHVAHALDVPTQGTDGVCLPLKATASDLAATIELALVSVPGAQINAKVWDAGRYSPTPTIIEAATALYAGHDVAEISRSDATATNLTSTTDAVTEVILDAYRHGRKSICFVTGVPGAGKTLVGLDVATRHLSTLSQGQSVFMSGNGPLVEILREALARDKVSRDDGGVRRGTARREVATFVQNVHHFRDECLVDEKMPPTNHVAIFDEAQRAWDAKQTKSFMSRKKGRPNFGMSEPEFLISCLDRHEDWAVIVCLVGGGQEINVGEAGIGEWLRAVRQTFPHWHVHLSPRFGDSEYGIADELITLAHSPTFHESDRLHLQVSMRSFRSEHTSLFVRQVLERDEFGARATLKLVSPRYPIVLTRNLPRAKCWLQSQARGSERYGLVASSQARRLVPLAIDVRSKIDPVHWFLNDASDIRSSNHLEDVGTEFHVQGLELDWTCVIWDADFRYDGEGWQCHSFVGTNWTNINAPDRRSFLKNAYRVLLTRARQGMVIVVPEGDATDPTRDPEHYERTYTYLKSIGLTEI